MDNILENLERLVHKEISQPVSMYHNEESLAQLSLILDKELHFIKQQMRAVLSSISLECQIQLYFQSYQIQLIELLNNLFTASLENPTKKSEAANVLYQFIENLLTSLQVNYPQFFNEDVLIPVPLAQNTIRNLNQTLAQLKEKKKQIPESLYQVVAEPIIQYEQSPFSITYQRHNYLRRYISELEKEHQKNEDRAEQIMTTFLLINYNTLSAFQYWTTYLKNEINQLETQKEKIAHLSFRLKGINQLPNLQDVVFDPNIKSLKKMVTQWIKEEKTHLESFPESVDIEKERTTPTLKLEFNLSVPQLAFLIRLLVETGIIKSVSDRQLLSFFAQNVSTKKASNISFESLRIAYYKTESSVIESLKALVIKMLNVIHDF